MTIYVLKVSFTESCDKADNILGLIEYELNSLLYIYIYIYLERYLLNISIE